MLIKETNFLLKWYKLIKAGFKSVAVNADVFFSYRHVRAGRLVMYR